MILNLKCLITPFDCPVCNYLAIPILYIAPPPAEFCVDLATRGILVLADLPEPQSIIPGWECKKCSSRFGHILTKEQWEEYLNPYVELHIF